MKSHLGLLFLIANLSQPAQAASIAPSMTAGSRFGVMVVQQMLASPPLPSPDKDMKQRISAQVGYSSGTIKGQYDDEGVTRGYSAKPVGWGAGLGYTSRSVGRFSFFGYALYTRATGDFLANDQNNNGIKDNVVDGKAGAFAVNMIVLGDLATSFNVGLFVGAQTVITHSFGKWGLLEATSNTPAGNIPIAMDQTCYGSLTGIQIKFRYGPASMVPYGLYFADLSNHCSALKYDDGLASSINNSCQFKVDMSYLAMGLMLGYSETRLTVYTKVINKIDQSDSDVVTYNLGYALAF